MKRMTILGVSLALCAIVLVTPIALADAPPVCIQKFVWGPSVVPLNTNIQWLIYIEIYTPVDIQNVVVTDRLGAELEIDTPFPYDITHGTASYTTIGASKKVFLTWNVGNLPAGTHAWLAFRISTDKNPAGQQEYTSCGCYYINSGATMKYYYMGVKYSETSNQLVVSVVEE